MTRRPPRAPLTRTKARAAAAATARACLACAATIPMAAIAIEIDTGNTDLTLRFDNTVKGSAIYRLHDADAALTDSLRPVAPGVFAPQAINFNAGDQNFRERGFVSQRLDLLSEFDAVYKRDFGLRVSAAAWYDRVYHRASDAPSDPLNSQSPCNEFPDYTQKIAGRKAEVLDAFVFGGLRFDNDTKLTARLGRHALQYGESLFYGDNGIAAAQGPTDIAKLLASPNAQFKEIVRPVPQLSAQLQISPTLTVGGYYQFRWEESRLPPSGSYFATSNIPWNSTSPEYITLPNPAGPPTTYVLTPGGDEKPRDSGQFGLQLKWRQGETDIGFYFAKYHDKYGQLYGRLNPAAPAANSRWFFVFPEDIKVAGVSASHTLGDVNLAGEVSVRDNMPLRVNNALYFGPSAVARPEFPTGRTAHVNLSMLAAFGPSFLAQESVLIAELAWNRVLHKDDPDGELDKGRTRDATAMQLIFTPTYRQALPGMDLRVPFGLRYTIDGLSSVTGWDARGNGSVNLGVEGDYLAVWQFGLTYTHYIGKSIPFVDYTFAQPRFGAGNPLGDRDYVALSIRRSF